MLDAELVGMALEECGTVEFEKYSQVLMGAVLGAEFVPLGGTGDGGADGFVFDNLFQEKVRPTSFFQASKQATITTKIRDTIARLKEFGRDPRVLFFVTSQLVQYCDQVAYDLGTDLNAQIRIFDRAYIKLHCNENANVEAAYRQYLEPAIAHILRAAAPSFPSQVPIPNAQAICAFLGQETERRLGTGNIHESLCDALILWALEITDPDKRIMLTRDEILGRVIAILPTAKQFLSGRIDDRLLHLTKKIEGHRHVNIYKAEGRYCLPHVARVEIQNARIEDEKLKAATSDSFLRRLGEVLGPEGDIALIEKLVDLAHKVLELVFQRQGYDVSRFFLDEGGDAGGAEAKTITDCIEEVLTAEKISANELPEARSLLKNLFRQIFYDSNGTERKYCGRLARTYILLFIIKNTPQVVEFFNAMASKFQLLLGSDILVRAIAEYYLPPSDQMTVNALKLIKQAGATLILTEPTLEEVHSHIFASDREYDSTYKEIDHFVDRDLASQSDRILIRSYYYSKLSTDLKDPPRSWAQFVGNFLTHSKLSGPRSAESMKSLRDTLCNRFSLVFEPRKDMMGGIKPDELKQVARKILDVRGDKGKGQEEQRAENDALHLLAVLRRREDENRQPTNPYGYQNWWLTQETKSSKALILAVPRYKGMKVVMRPEFLVNYIAYNPSKKEVQDSLRTIFPSLLGIQLGNRLDERTFKIVMGKISEAHKLDDARAISMVAEHSDALKSDKMREYLVKYDVQKS